MNPLETSIKTNNEIHLWNKKTENTGKWTIEKSQITTERLNYLKNAAPNLMISQPFIQKLLWFRLQLEKLRIPWTVGSDAILIKSGNIIQDSLNFISVCNMQKVNMQYLKKH